MSNTPRQILDHVLATGRSRTVPELARELGLTLDATRTALSPLVTAGWATLRGDLLSLTAAVAVRRTLGLNSTDVLEHG